MERRSCGVLELDSIRIGLILHFEPRSMRQLLASFMLIVCAPLLAQEGCELFNIQELSDAYLNFQVDTIIELSEGTFEVQLSNGTTFMQVQGCTNSTYLEYNASANTDDGSCATLLGCTDSAYLEYNAAAGADDGSCATLLGCTDSAYLEYNAAAGADDGSCATLLGCTIPAFLEYNASALIDDGSCATLLGCTDSAYLEYNAAAGADDGSCSTVVVEGCTNPAYEEYDATANTDDGSCATLLGCTDSAYLEYNAAAVADDGSCSTVVVEGCTDSNYTEYNASANTDDGSCVTVVVEGCMDSDYTEYNATANTDDGSCSTAVVEGCTDTAYLEYNASANTDDGSCATLVGCTDSAYLEYNAAAVADDGSCATPVVNGCTDPTYEEYDAMANTDDGSCATLPYCHSPTMDNYSYGVVEIGNQCWFAENLRTTVYADGSSIPEVTSSPAWSGLNTGARCDYNNDASTVAAWGRLYNWHAVMDAAGLCPNGWHVPTDGEWIALENYLSANGFNGVEGTALKSTSGWDDYEGESGNGTDNFGYTALPAGYRTRHGPFTYAGGLTRWWSSSNYGGQSWALYLIFFSSQHNLNYYHPRTGHSVRCLRDPQ